LAPLSTQTQTLRYLVTANCSKMQFISLEISNRQEQY